MSMYRLAYMTGITEYTSMFTGNQKSIESHKASPSTIFSLKLYLACLNDILCLKKPCTYQYID